MYEVKKKVTKIQEVKTVESIEVQGFTVSLTRVCRGKSTTTELWARRKVGKRYVYYDVLIANDELYQEIKRWGWAQVKEVQHRIKRDAVLHFQSLASGDSSGRTLLLHSYDFTFYDLTVGKWFHTLHYNHIRGTLDNLNFDLGPLMAHLRKHKMRRHIYDLRESDLYDYEGEGRTKALCFQYFTEADPAAVDTFVGEQRSLSELGVDKFKRAGGNDYD